MKVFGRLGWEEGGGRRGLLELEGDKTSVQPICYLLGPSDVAIILATLVYKVCNQGTVIQGLVVCL